jgi:acetylglutamate kinase
VNADWAANELVKRLQPYKIIFLTGTGGLLDANGRVIDSISLTSQYAELMKQPWLHSGMRVKMEQIHDMLMELPPSSSLSITRPSEMAKELFTHRGSGTLVRRGEEIRTLDSWDGLDRDRFSELVSTSFGRPLVSDYFDRVEPKRVYVSEHYRAAIVVARSGGIDYMDKFAVVEEAQGEGLGRAVWDVMRAHHGSLAWRSRIDNPINDFYFTHCDGAMRTTKWTVFWYGLPGWDDVRHVVDSAGSLPATLED